MSSDNHRKRPDSIRVRARRCRALAALDGLPDSRDFEHGCAVALREFLKARGITTSAGVIEPWTGKVVDRDAASLVRHLIRSLKAKGFNADTLAAMHRIWARLGLGKQPRPRSRKDRDAPLWRE